MKRLRSIILLFVLIYLAIMSVEIVITLDEERDIIKNGATVLSSFWDIQFGGPGGGLFSEIMSLIIITFVGSFSFIYLKNNHAFYNVQQRIDYRGYLSLALRRTMIAAAVLSILVKIYQLLLILLITRTLPSNIPFPEEMMFGLTAFNDNTLMSVAVFTVLSAIGWAVYAAFIFSIGLFVKKNAVYVVLGAVVGLMLIALPSLINIPSELVSTLFYVFLMANMISPGQAIFNSFNGNPPNVYLAFVLASLFYAGIAYLLIRLWVRRQRMEG